MAKKSKNLEPLLWIIKFAQMDLSSLRKGDWMNLQGELGVFLRNVPGFVLGPMSGLLMADTFGKARKIFERSFKLSRKEFIRLQNTLLRDLQTLALDPNKRLGNAFNSIPPIDGASISIITRRPDLAFTFIISAHKNIIDYVRGAFFSHLTTSGIVGSQLRVCPECNRIFLLWRKPQPGRDFYCGTTCTNKAALRRFRRGWE